MSSFRDLLSVAWTGLTARKVRTLLIMLGPIVGVAAMVGAVGLTESAKGDLKAKLGKLGTNLIIAQAGGTFGSQNPTFPKHAGLYSNVDGWDGFPAERDALLGHLATAGVTDVAVLTGDFHAFFSPNSFTRA